MLFLCYSCRQFSCSIYAKPNETTIRWALASSRRGGDWVKQLMTQSEKVIDGSHCCSRLRSSLPCVLLVIHWFTSLRFSTIPMWVRCFSPCSRWLAMCTTTVSLRRYSHWLRWHFGRQISSSLLMKLVWRSSKNSVQRVSKAMSSTFTRHVRVIRLKRKSISPCSGNMDARKCIWFSSRFDPFCGYVGIS